MSYHQLVLELVRSISAVHWLIILSVLLIAFGPGRLEDVGKGISSAWRRGR